VNRPTYVLCDSLKLTLTWSYQWWIR